MRRLKFAGLLSVSVAIVLTVGVAQAPARIHGHARGTHFGAHHARARHLHFAHARPRAEPSKPAAADAGQRKADAVSPAPAEPSAQPPAQAPNEAQGSAPSEAQNCPGNSQALGTSRVMTIEPGQYQRLGLMQYRETLPLADKEVVLTFDDGPLPPYSNEILDILASQCVKVTYFIIGEMAKAYPSVVRRMYEAGHTIGTHSMTHPIRWRSMPIEKVRSQIDDGIAAVAAALGDRDKVAPFFRIPGLMRTDALESELAARSLIIFSADVVADDWRHIGSREIVRRAMSRLEARGKGILLLHDIHAATVAALPELLKELKEQGFHVVHIVPGAGGRIETAAHEANSTADAMVSLAEARRVPKWPSAAAEVTSQRIALPAPDTDEFDTGYRPWRHAMLAEGAEDEKAPASGDTVARWPDQSETVLPACDAELPVPSLQDIGISPEGLQVVGETTSLAVTEPGAPLASAPTSHN